MAMTAGGTSLVCRDINITPFIDVLLVLLVIFMLSVKVRQVLQAQLAQQVMAGTKTMKHPIVLELRNDGSYALNQHVVGRGELPGVLWRGFARREESILVLKARPPRLYR